MTFAASRPISADKLSIRYVDAFADLPAAGSVPLGTQIFVQADNSYYIAQPSATAPHAASWRAAGVSIGVNGSVATLLGGLQVPVRTIGDANGSVTADDFIVEFNVALTAPRTLDLTPAETLGRTLIIKSNNAVNGANVVNLSATVDGAAGQLPQPYSSLFIYYDGTRWLGI